MKSMGCVAYEAYCNHTGWKSLVSGADLPQWGALSPEIRTAWEAAANAVLGKAARGSSYGRMGMAGKRKPYGRPKNWVRQRMEDERMDITPGPWTCGPLLLAVDQDWVPFDRSVCIYPPSMEEAGIDYQPSGPVAIVAVQESEGNASLISAAPDLLEALRGVMQWIDNWDPNLSDDPEWPNERDRAMNAIAKATSR